MKGNDIMLLHYEKHVTRFLKARLTLLMKKFLHG